jgi:hypothetical protein
MSNTKSDAVLMGGMATTRARMQVAFGTGDVRHEANIKYRVVHHCVAAYKLASETLRQYAEDAGLVYTALSSSKFPLKVKIFCDLLQDRRRKVAESIDKIERGLVKIQDVEKEAAELREKKDAGREQIQKQSGIVDSLLIKVGIP